MSSGRKRIAGGSSQSQFQTPPSKSSPALIEDNLLNYTSTTWCSTDPDYETCTKSTTSLLHNSPQTIISQVISPKFPALLLPTKKHVTLQNSCVYYKRSSSPPCILLFFIHPVIVGTTSSGMPVKAFVEYNLRFDLAHSNSGTNGTNGTSVSTAPSSGTDTDDHKPPVLTISTLTDAHLYDLATPEYQTNVWARRDAHSEKLTSADFSATLKLLSNPFKTTQATITAAMRVKKKSQSSTSGLSSSSGSSLSSSGVGKFVSNIYIGSLKTGSYTPNRTAVIDHIGRAIPFLHGLYAQYDSYDKQLLSHFTTTTVPTAPPLAPLEAARLATVQSFDDDATFETEEEKIVAMFEGISEGWGRVSNTVMNPIGQYKKVAVDTANAAADSTVLGQAHSPWRKNTATFDSNKDHVAAWLWSFMSYERVHQHMRGNARGSAGAHGVRCRKVIAIPNSHSQISISQNRLPGTFDDRYIVLLWTWKQEPDGSFVLAFTDVDDETMSLAGPLAADITAEVNSTLDRIKGVRASTRGYWKVCPVKDAPDICSVSVVYQSVLRGSVSAYQYVSSYFAKTDLAVITQLADKFERNARVVDDEMRKATMPPPPIDELTDEQKALIDDGRGLERVIYQKIESPPFIQHEMSVASSSRSIISKTSGVVDTDARLAMAWLSTFSSRVFMKNCAKLGVIAQCCVRENTPHDEVNALIYKMPFPFRPRELVSRHSCATEANGDFVMAAKPADDEPDYGIKLIKVRVIIHSFFRITPINPTRCRVTLFRQGDLGGALGNNWLQPARVRRSLIETGGYNLVNMRAEFQRDAEVDKADRGAFAARIRDEVQIYTEEEEALIERVQSNLLALPETDFDALVSDDHLVTMTGVLRGERAGAARASSVVDASVEDCASYDMAGMVSRAQEKETGESDETLLRSLSTENDHSHILHVVNGLGRGFQPREFLSRRVWRKQEDGSHVVAYEPIDLPSHPLTSKYVRGSALSLMTYDALPPVSGIPQTRVTLTTVMTLNGSAPRAALLSVAARFLQQNVALRKEFDKSLELDGKVRAQIVTMITDHTAEYTEKEKAILKECETQLNWATREKGKRIKTSSPLTDAKVSAKTGNGQYWGFASTHVRASQEAVLAYRWDLMKRVSLSQYDLERNVDEQENDHNKLFYLKTKQRGIATDRDFLSRVIWEEQGGGIFLLTTTPEQSARRPIDLRRKSSTLRRRNSYTMGGNRTVRAMFLSCMRIQTSIRTGVATTKIEYFIRPSYGGWHDLSRWAVERSLRLSLIDVTKAQEYFLEQRGVDDYDVEDGKALGVRLMHPGGEGGKKPWRKVGEVVQKHRGLRELENEFGWLSSFLEEVIKGQLHMNKSVRTKLECLDEAEARKIGRNLSPSLKSRKTAQAGLFQWEKQNRSMVQLFKRHEWLESMLLSISQEIMKTAPWGLALRVCVGAGLSVLDMVTDVLVIIAYMKEETTRGYGYSLLGMIGASFTIQLVLVLLQHIKRPAELPMEVLAVLTGLKPGLDASRVCLGKRKMPHEVLDAKMELVATKAIEMLCESIPGCVLQLYVMLKLLEVSESLPVFSLVSVAVSSLTAGFNVATINYDFDTDPVKRKEFSEFYGYIPDEANLRIVLLIIMTLNSALMVLARSTTTAMFLLTSVKGFAVYMCADVGFYLAVKVWRKDFWHLIPIDGVSGVVVSFMVRVAVKTITDFTAMVQTRHPGEMGGVQWLVNLGISFVACGMSVWMYEGEGRIGFVVGGGFLLWGVTGWLAFVLCKREYRRTFWSLKTSSQVAIERFFLAEADDVKATVFKTNHMLWQDIETDVSVWVRSGWWDWREDQPPWFTDSWIASVPLAMIPEEDAKGVARVKASVRRKSKFGVSERGMSGRKQSVLYVEEH